MAKIYTPWTKQPQVPVLANPYWLARGLTCLVQPWVATDAVSRISLGVLTTIPTTTVRGGLRGVNPASATSGLSLPVQRSLQIAAAKVTVVTIVTRIGSASQYSRVADCAWNGAGNGGWSLEADNADGLNAVAWDGNTAVATSFGAMALNQNYVFVATNTGSEATTYVNGVRKTGPVTAKMSAGTSTSPFAIGCTQSTSNGGVGFLIHLVASFNRVLTEVEIVSLSQNPWQLFQPLSRNMWIPDAAATGFKPHWAINRSQISGGR